MAATNGAGPALCDDRDEARQKVVLGNGQPSDTPPSAKSQEPIRAELIGSTICTGAGITTDSVAPVLALCRQLLANGLDVDRSLEVYRRGMLALRIRSITETAGLEVNAKGTDFVPRAVRTASPMRSDASLLAPEPERAAAPMAGISHVRRGR